MEAGAAATAAGTTLRWVRACVLAVVAVTTGVTAHGVAGGRLPTVGVLLLAVVVITAAAAPLLRHPASTRRVVLVLAGGETCFHLMLTALTRSDPHPAASMLGMHHLTAADHPGHAAVMGAGDASGWPLPGLGLSGQDVLMADAHLAAVG